MSKFGFKNGIAEINDVLKLIKDNNSYDRIGLLGNASNMNTFLTTGTGKLIAIKIGEKVPDGVMVLSKDKILKLKDKFTASLPSWAALPT